MVAHSHITVDSPPYQHSVMDSTLPVVSKNASPTVSEAGVNEKDEKSVSPSGSSPQLGEAVPELGDEAMDRRVWRKLDIRLIPVLIMFYLLSFLVNYIPPFDPFVLGLIYALRTAPTWAMLVLLVCRGISRSPTSSTQLPSLSRTSHIFCRNSLPT